MSISSSTSAEPGKPASSGRQQPSGRKLLRSTGTVGGFTLLSRILGLVRGDMNGCHPVQGCGSARVGLLPGVQAAYSFTSSWHPAPDERGEGWLEHGIHDAYAKLM